MPRVPESLEVPGVPGFAGVSVVPVVPGGPGSLGVPRIFCWASSLAGWTPKVL